LKPLVLVSSEIPLLGHLVVRHKCFLISVRDNDSARWSDGASNVV
jgi:hypothetical protein